MLKPTRGNSRPTNIIVFDTETTQIQLGEKFKTHVLKLGVAKHCRKRKNNNLNVESSLNFTEPQELWSYVDSKCRSKTTTYIFAHNISYDLSVSKAFSNLEALEWHLEGYYAKALVGIFRWCKGDKKLVALSSTNLFPRKLEYWGEVLQFPKLQIDFDNTSNRDLLIYCERDVDIVIEMLRLWYQFLDKHDVGNFKVTTGSTAIEFFRHRFLKHDIYIHNHEKSIELERKAYHGGRVETLFLGYKDDDTYYYLDINNMYGYILGNRLFPTGHYGYLPKSNLEHLALKLDKFAVIAEVLLDTPENWFPYEINGRIIYPIGTFKTTLSTPELQLALKRNWIKDVYAITWFKQEQIFKEYIEYCYNLRMEYKQQNQLGYSEIMKLMINSLYGKFGQRGLQQYYIGENTDGISWSETVWDEVHKQYYTLRAIGSSVFREENEGDSYNTFVAIASHVTAYARMYLKFLMNKIPQGHIFYCDTDGFVVDTYGKALLSEYIQPTKIGMLKIEDTSDFIRINAPKDYDFNKRVKRKGIPKSSRQLSDNTYEVEQWANIASLINSGRLEAFYTTTIIKKLTRLNYCGYPDYQGYVHPWIVQPDGSIVGLNHGKHFAPNFARAVVSR